MNGEPTRLTDGSEAPAGLRNLLASAREDVPNESQLKRMATRLGPLLGGAAIGSAAGVGAASGSGAAAGATGSVALGVKVGAALVAAGLVGGGALWYATRGHTPPPAPPAAPVAAPAAPVHAARAPAAKPPEDTAQTPPKAEPAKPSAPTKAGDSAHKAAPAEASLLQAAQSALKTDPKRALALVDEHRRLYPNGALSQEREVIAIEALTRLGRNAQAREKAKDFKQRYPDSAHESKVGATVEGE